MKKTRTSIGRIVVRILAVTGAAAIILVAVSAVAGFLYWRHVKSTPQYSLALIVEATKADDTEQLERLIDTDAAVDAFLPQIVEQAVDMYGRGLPPTLVKHITSIATPFLPVVKKRARAELPKVLREKTRMFEDVPFWVAVFGAERLLNFEYKENGTVTVTGKQENRPFELTMKRNGEVWQVVGVKDRAFAKRIAEKFGQEMIAAAKNRGKQRIERLGKEVGIPNLGEIIKKTEDILKR